MPKSIASYWNPLNPEQANQWQAIEGLEGQAEELTLSIDPDTVQYTRLTRFRSGADTMAFDSKSHVYSEEISILSGRLYDQGFDIWLECGHYASRPPGEVHGPFKTDTACAVLEVSYPDKSSE